MCFLPPGPHDTWVPDPGSPPGPFSRTVSRGTAGGDGPAGPRSALIGSCERRSFPGRFPRPGAFDMAAQTWRRWALATGFWALVGLFFSVQNYLIETRVEAMDATFADALVNMLPNTLVWAVLAPQVLKTARHLRVGRANWMTALPLQALIGCLVAFLHSLLAVTLFVWLVRAFGHELRW